MQISNATLVEIVEKSPIEDVLDAAVGYMDFMYQEGVVWSGSDIDRMTRALNQMLEMVGDNNGTMLLAGKAKEEKKKNKYEFGVDMSPIEANSEKEAIEMAESAIRNGFYELEISDVEEVK